MVEGILTLLFGILSLGGLVWLTWAADKAEAEEDKQLKEEIAHLPEDMQIRLWAAHLRNRAERDML
jgi:cbb3-type cytochrome oxidase subunit 3